MGDSNVRKATEEVGEAPGRRSARASVRNKPLGVGQEGTEEAKGDLQGQGSAPSAPPAGTSLREVMFKELRSILTGPHQVRTKG